ncbi:enoyl-CoA hydratase/isomerase family protein [Haladaptatus sp. CMSO5]|uniref:enoyl-CoA hydratase/isomerase family protein n=1 Tax=Haladaptatus sp. CMSO5 TaxID=3120514 RepID=UPI002FCE20CB
MSYERIVYELHADDDRLAAIRLDNPERHNVLDERMVLELYDAFDRADQDSSVQGILLTSSSDTFCAGADLGELNGLTFEEGARWLTTYFEAIDMLRDTGKPAVAAIEGTCVAGGNELVMGCDLIVAGRSARFGQPEVGVGSTAAGGGVQLLPLIVGEKRAREMLLTGSLLSAPEAERIGLINRVVEDGDAEAHAVELLQTIVDTKSPQAYRTIKTILKPWTNFGLLAEEMARDMTANVWASDEFTERANAFLKREELKPREFTGTQPRTRD